MNCRTSVAAIALFSVAFTAAWPSWNGELRDAVTVKRNAETVEEAVLDPSHPPEIIRERLGKHSAYTYCNYRLDWLIHDDLKSHAQKGDKVAATIDLSGIDVTLQLAITLYLPQSVSKKLRDHETGHQHIAERVYDDAEAEARRLAERMIGRSFSGEAATLNDARGAARKSAGDELIAKYLDAVQVEGQRIHDLYDEITHHGADLRIDEDDAIRKAFDQRQQQKKKKNKG